MAINSLRRSVLLVAFAILLLPAAGYCLGGHDADPANQISRESAKCQAVLAKASLKFGISLFRSLSRCFDGVILCDQSSDADAQAACIGKLLAIDSGRCAQGRLGGGIPYFGNIIVSPVAASRIDKALYRFVAKVEPACIVAAGVDLSTSGTGLGADPFFPGSSESLIEAVNSGVAGRGVACSVHRLLHDAYPLLEEIADLLLSHPGIEPDFAVAIRILAADDPPDSDCR